MSALRWTNKSTEAMAEELTRQGHPVSDKTVARCLREMGYSMQLNQKTREGPQHRNRDEQFRYINRQVASFRKSGDPVLSVDTKKKELVGAFKNGVRTWRPKREPHRVNAHDFPSMAEGKAIPYGADEIGEDRAVVNVGVTHDTAEFAVESIRRWWKLAGRLQPVFYDQVGGCEVIAGRDVEAIARSPPQFKCEIVQPPRLIHHGKRPRQSLHQTVMIHHKDALPKTFSDRKSVV